MRSYSSEAGEQSALTRDLQAFAWAVVKHWWEMIGLLASSTAATLFGVTAKDMAAKEIGAWVCGAIGLLCLLIACFRAWREQFHAVRQKSDEIADRDAKIEFLTKPRWRLECGDGVKGANARGRPRIYSQRDGSHAERPVDFLGFVITNEGAVTAHRCKCMLTKIQKHGDEKPLFDEFTTLHFAPEKPADDFNTEVDIRSGQSWSVALCTTVERHVLFSSLGADWRFGSFESMFREPGRYIFSIQITSDDAPTADAELELSWTGKREGTNVSIFTPPSGSPNLSFGRFPQSTKRDPSAPPPSRE
jgi:hypothetical protein